MKINKRASNQLPFLLISLLILLYSAEKVQNQTIPQTPMLLLENCNVYNPEPMGLQNILIGGNSILEISPAAMEHWKSLKKAFSQSNTMQVINCEGMIVLPGLIDPHVHVSGGGGESGPASRTPNAQLGELINAGITTLIGLRGTDSITRSAENVLQFLYSLEADGLSTFMWTGSYHVPVLTLTDTLQRDIILIEKIIGAGEIAISDHRSSWPSFQQLVELVSNCRVGGMLGGKAGVAYFHVGSAPSMLNPLWDIVNQTSIPISQMFPTHMSSRGMELVDEGIKWINRGGYLDFTADTPSENETSFALDYYRAKNVNLTHVTLSSDAYGSAPVYNKEGQLISYEYASPSNLLNQLRTMVTNYKWGITEAFRLATSNTADYLQLNKKGRIQVGRDADLLVLDDRLQLLYVIAKGVILKTPDVTTHGMFPCM